jgi:hypothetical protein
MFLLNIRSLMNHRSALLRRRSSHGSRSGAWRVAPRLIPLEVRALLSTITVTNDGDSGPGSLRQALATAVAGETIQFARSAYGTITLSSGPLAVSSRLAIDGPGANKLTINGNNTFQDLQVQANVSATVSGLTITGGQGPTGSPYGGGGIVNDGTLTLASCVVTKNSVPGYDMGGGIDNIGSLTVTNSVVSDNTAASGGGIESSGELVLKSSTITGNSSEFGGGGLSTSGGNLNLTTCVVSGNVGGGIRSYAAVTTLADCSVTGNSAAARGAGPGIYSSAANLNLINCVVSGNTAGGITIVGNGTAPTLTVTDSSIVNNSQTGSGYYAAEAGGIGSVMANVTVTGSLIANNLATGFNALGGGIAMETGFVENASANILTVTDSTFQGNQAIGTTAFGEAYGGAIHTDPGATISVTGSSFQDNTASGAFVAQGGAMDLQFLTQGTITNSQFVSNQAVGTGLFPSGAEADGGAIANTGSYPLGLTISGSTFMTNVVNGGPNGGSGFGGAIANQGLATLNLSSSLLVGNRALGGAGATSGGNSVGGFGGGGALINLDPAIATVTDSTLIGNAAIGGADAVAGGQAGPGYGGAIQNAGATLSVTDSTIVGNVVIGGAASNGATAADGQGGGIQNFIGGLLNVSGGTVIGNSAIGGAGGGNGQGGGVFNSGSAAFSGVLITLNSAWGGSAGGQGVGGGLYITTGAVTLSPSTKVAGNHATTSNDNIYGPYTTS